MASAAQKRKAREDAALGLNPVLHSTKLSIKQRQRRKAARTATTEQLAKWIGDLAVAKDYDVAPYSVDDHEFVLYLRHALAPKPNKPHTLIVNYAKQTMVIHAVDGRVMVARDLEALETHLTSLL